METDIEALIAAWREQRKSSASGIEFTDSTRNERMMNRRKEQDEVFEREFRRQAASVIECVTQEYSPDRLHDWFLLDNWTAQDALVLLCGFDPKHIPFDNEGYIAIPAEAEFEQRRKIEQIRRLDNLPLYRMVTEQILGKGRVHEIDWEFRSSHRQMVRVWESGTHTEPRYPPKYFLDWALRKKFSIPWLAWAKDHRYYDDPPSTVTRGEPAANDSKDVAPKSETAYTHIIGALVDLYWRATHPGEEYMQTTILAELKQYEGFSGMSERNLKEKLTKAWNAIKS